MTNLLFEITNACSEVCEYCYARDRDITHADPQMVEHIVRKIAAEETIGGITLIGGEPLEHPGILDIVARLSALDLPLAITTNAQHLDDKRMHDLLDLGVRTFEVSLDSVDSTIFRELGRGQDVEIIKYRIAKLVRAGANVTVSVVLSRLNQGCLEALTQYCFALGVVGMSVLRVLRPELAKRGSNLALGHDELSEALIQLDKLSGQLGIPIVCSTPIEPCHFKTKKLSNLIFPPCSCGDSKWIIDPLGNLRTCELSKTSLGNMKESSFATLSKQSSAITFREKNRHSHCSKCRHLQRCGGGCRFLEEAPAERTLAANQSRRSTSLRIIR